MKTTTTIRDLLFKEMEDLANGKSDIKKAKAMTKISAQIIYSTRLEIENKKIEVEIAKANKEVQNWMKKDFSKIQNIQVGA